MKTAIIYSFNTRNTADVAKQLQAALKSIKPTILNAEEITAEQFLAYDNLILGVPSWFHGELPNYWDEFVPDLKELNLKGKKIAIFGNGDQKGYPDHFVDSIGVMAELLEKQGAVLLGSTSTEGYSFTNSKAVRNGNFIGLAIDTENQSELSPERIVKWANQLVKEFAL